ncbi:MAG: hypothetical protein RLO18_13900, partial [Gimesia chilikensis]
MVQDPGVVGSSPTGAHSQSESRRSSMVEHRRNSGSPLRRLYLLSKDDLSADGSHAFKETETLIV